MKFIFYTIITALLLIGCDQFKSAPEETEDLSEMETADPVVEETSDSAMVEKMEQVQEEPELTIPSVADGVVSIEQVDDKYMIVIGSFENANLAKQHAEKFKNLGYQTQVVAKSDGFHMVTAKAFDTFRSAKADLPTFKQRIAHHSWVYINDPSFGKK